MTYEKYDLPYFEMHWRNSSHHAYIHYQQRHSCTHPKPDHGEGSVGGEGEGDGVGSAREEGGQPHVQVVPCSVHPIQQILYHTRVVRILRQNIDVAWVS